MQLLGVLPRGDNSAEHFARSLVQPGMKTIGIFSVALAGLLALGSGLRSQAAGLIIVDDPVRLPSVPGSPGPLAPPAPFPRRYAFAPLEVEYVRVNTRINDQVAASAVDQEFYNPNGTSVEGTFVFPVPKGAHLDKFTMEVDGHPAEAELVSAEKARRIYEDIVRKLRDPALLEYADRDLFKVRIFPIEPHGKKRIHLAYTEVLKSEAGLVKSSFPLNTEKFSAKPVKSLTVKVAIETKRPLKTIYSPSHAVEVRRDGATRATAGFEASDQQPADDFALYFAPEKDEIGLNLLTYKTEGEDGYFLLFAAPGLEGNPSKALPKDVVFVLDTSGSMMGPKLEQAKKALRFCVEGLNDDDHFQILRFSTEVESVFHQLEPATQENRRRATSFIKDLRAAGGTAIDEALKAALALRGSQPLADSEKSSRGRPFVVIFLTDGQPTIGVTDENQLVEHASHEAEGNVRIFCFGIGNDVNAHLLDRIAESTRASSEYVLPEEDIEVKVSIFYAKIKEPAMATPTLEFTSGVHVSKMYPSRLPDLFKGEQIVVAGRYSGSGPTAIILKGNVEAETRKFTYETRFPASAEGNDFVPRLWATRRVGYLLDEIRFHGESTEVRDEVTDLARKYGIVTPYTAYLILDDESRRHVPFAFHSLQNIERDRSTMAAAAGTYDSLKQEHAGENAVLGAVAGNQLKMADAPAVAAAAGSASFERRYGLPPAGVTRSLSSMAPAAPDADKAKVAEYTQQNRFMAGKTFFQNGSQWTDSEAQKLTKAKRQRIQFNSAAYFELIARNPEALPWLSLGQNVQFVLNNTFYEIYE